MNAPSSWRAAMDVAMLNWPMSPLHDVQLVGVVNTSHDSYFVPSYARDVDAAIALARRHIQEGAHFIEVGGLSGGSAAKRVSSKEEAERSLPVIEALAAEFPQVTLTIDTFRSEIADSALSAGATWVNDVTGATFDSKMMEVVAKHDATIIIMHLEGPGGHAGRKLNRPFFHDVVGQVKDYFLERIAALELAGIPKSRIVVDVGFGAGKRPGHDYELLANVKEFSGLGCRQMGACSRKQLVEAVCPVPPSERLGGSIMAAMWCALNGCDLLRVHEVRPYAQALDVWNGIMGRLTLERGRHIDATDG